MSERRRVQVSVNPLGCLFWLAIIVLFVAALNWATGL